MFLLKEKESKQDELNKLIIAILQVSSRNNEQKEEEKVPQGTKLEPKRCNLIFSFFAGLILMSCQECWYCTSMKSSDITISTNRVKKWLRKPAFLKNVYI